MGVSKSPTELVAKLEQTAAVIGGENRGAVAAAAQAYKAATVAAGTRDSGGDLRLSRWGRRGGLKLSVGYDLDGAGAVVSAIVKPRPLGPWKVLEYGSRPHVIAAGLSRRQGQALQLFAVMAGGRGDYDLGALTSIARGNRNNRRTRTGKRGSQALKIGGDFRPYARHPGSAPKHTWSDGFRAGSKPALAVYRSKQFTAVAKVFQ